MSAWKISLGLLALLLVSSTRAEVSHCFECVCVCVCARERERDLFTMKSEQKEVDRIKLDRDSQIMLFRKGFTVPMCFSLCVCVCVCVLNLRKAGSRGAKTIISEKSKDSSCK